MKDRRVRLRPKNGARQLYYSTAGIVNTQGINLFDNTLPWQSSSPINNSGPNTPNILSGLESGINNIEGLASSAITGLSNAVTNLPNTINGIVSTVTNAIGQSFGNGAGTSVLGSPVNILDPLAQTDGFVFPYTPKISLNQSVDYASQDVVHTNQEFLSYTRTKSPVISVSGEFIVQNSYEASYALACVHFLRTIVKMSFGQDSQNPGTPPPILIFSAYGTYMFPEVPVIVQAYSVDFPSDVDYIQVPNTDTLVPAMFTITLNLLVQQTPTTLRKFNLQSFRNGSLMANGSGWI